MKQCQNSSVCILQGGGDSCGGLLRVREHFFPYPGVSLQSMKECTWTCTSEFADADPYGPTLQDWLGFGSHCHCYQTSPRLGLDLPTSYHLVSPSPCSIFPPPCPASPRKDGLSASRVIIWWVWETSGLPAGAPAHDSAHCQSIFLIAIKQLLPADHVFHWLLGPHLICLNTFICKNENWVSQDGKFCFYICAFAFKPSWSSVHIGKLDYAFSIIIGICFRLRASWNHPFFP